MASFDGASFARAAGVLGVALACVLAASLATGTVRAGQPEAGPSDSAGPVATAVPSSPTPTETPTTESEGTGPTSDPDRVSDQEKDPGETSPGDSSTHPQSVEYLVEWGDTLATISTQFAVSVDRIVEANAIVDPNVIYAGSTLVIPVG